MTRGQAAAILDRTVRYIAQGPGVLKPLSQEKPVQPTALANGQAITEENVLKILDELRAQYPENTDFTPGYPQGNNSQVQDATFPYQRVQDIETHTSNTIGCGGWATLLSDTIFSQGGFPCRKVDMKDGRPGDIMVLTDPNGYLVHVAILEKRPTVAGNGSISFTVTEAATDSRDVYRIHWDNNYSWPSDGKYTYDIWTRYPA